jgi:hypothetical protein
VVSPNSAKVSLPQIRDWVDVEVVGKKHIAT